jgi:hypothetical protein
MSLKQSLVAAHVIETAQNFARADDPLLDHSKPVPGQQSAQGEQTSNFFEEEGIFWEQVFHSPSHNLNQLFNFTNMRLSEWVARVPGLSWKPESQLLNNSVKGAQKAIAGKYYPPETRSTRVMAGVGTLRLPPADDGSRLGTLGLSGDVSAGVPVLLAADVWDKIQVDYSCEGLSISGRARWVPMALQWSAHFPVIRDIPRGYLYLDNPDAISADDSRLLTYITPFTIMEYSRDSNLLYDYVYIGARTDDADYRQQVENSFQEYPQSISQDYRYLITADMVQPMWDAEFLSPADLRRVDASAKSQLALLEERVRERLLGKQIVEPLLAAVSKAIEGDPDSLIVLSGEVQLKTGVWLAGGSLAEQASQFVHAILQHGKVDALLAALAARDISLVIDQ